MSSGTSVATAIALGVDFLRKRQMTSGEFPVFTSLDPDMVGESSADASVFSTSLIAHCLGFAPQTEDLRAGAVAFLRDQMDGHGLWRHWTRDHPHYDQLPPDLDDTSCVSAVLEAHGDGLPADRQLLLANRNNQGLFYTWLTPRPCWNRSGAYWRVALAQLRYPLTLLAFFRMTSARPDDIDAIVNANTLHYLGEGKHADAVISHLMEVLREDREAQCDKWYNNPFAVWYFLSRALHRLAPEAGDIIDAKVRAARPRNALDAALGACSLLYWNRAPGQTLIASLLEQQGPSGEWPRASLYFGGRTRLAKAGFAPPVPGTPYWGSEELTTAFAVEALSRHALRQSQNAAPGPATDQADDLK